VSAGNTWPRSARHDRGGGAVRSSAPPTVPV